MCGLVAWCVDDGLDLGLGLGLSLQLSQLDIRNFALRLGEG